MVLQLGNRAVRSATLLAAACLAASQLVLTRAPAAEAEPDVPPVLSGDTWLAHHRDELMPYWTGARGVRRSRGQFSVVPRHGRRAAPGTAEPRRIHPRARCLRLLARLHADRGRRYLTYARAGLDWIETKAEDPVHGGYFAELDATGEPVDPLANKDSSTWPRWASAYAMYFNATRDPEVEARLLEIRDLRLRPVLRLRREPVEGRAHLRPEHRGRHGWERR